MKAHLCLFEFDFAWFCGMKIQCIRLLDSDGLIWNVMAESSSFDSGMQFYFECVDMFFPIARCIV